MTLWSPRMNLMAVLISRSHLLQRSHREISPSGSGKIKEQEHKRTFFFFLLGTNNYKQISVRVHVTGDQEIQAQQSRHAMCDAEEADCQSTLKKDLQVIQVGPLKGQTDYIGKEKTLTSYVKLKSLSHNSLTRNVELLIFYLAGLL